ncbi:hypothetical protein [Azospirillum sp.]|uniref:hypothetical protein n=1 Tax=Azospirillum sp. TaxID=34012 RepID=UPI003D754ABD
MKFLRAVTAYAISAAIVVGGYHAYVGYSVYQSVEAQARANGKTLPGASFRTLIVGWPGMLATVAFANGEVQEVMTDTMKILDELNSGRWQRVAAPSSDGQ